jgi:microcystin-dependent protein
MPITPFIGEFMIFAGNFAPKGWALCDGQLLSISENTPLFALIGTFYGGNGTTNFALPDMRGRLSVHQGQGSGLSPYQVGQKGGEEDHTLLTAEAPSHTHAVNAHNNGNTGGVSTPGAGVVMGSPYAVEANSPAVPIYSTDAPTLTMSGGMVGQTGGSVPHNNLMPYLTLNWCIALQGIFPTRN